MTIFVKDTVTIRDGVYAGKQGTVEVVAKDISKCFGVHVAGMLAWFTETELECVQTHGDRRIVK